jgi:outer membrane protein OmpA-like peptidoglycan-associated protein
MRKTLLGLSLVLAVFACKKHESAPPATTQQTSSSIASATPPATATTLPAHKGENLVALASGAFPVIRASAPEQGGSAYYMFDEDSNTGWTSNGGKFAEPTVVELADRGVIKQIGFDEKVIEWDGRLPRKVLVEISDTSATDGFKPIANVAMTEQKDGQTFPVSAEVPGRWVRLRVQETGSKDGIAQIMEFRAVGDRLSHNPIPNVTGTYETNAGTFHLKQEGATVTGCYDHATEPLIGGMEGRILKFKYAIGESGSGPALLVVSDAGDLFGGWWRTDSTVTEHPKLDPIEGKRTSTDPGATACPQWSPEQGMAAELKKSGRVRLYGINFDSDSDVIRDESKPTLDQVASMLKSNADLKLTIEGHTDSTATPEHNQDLSTRRANSVRQYLVTKGIEAARLDAAGFGATKPVASNDNALGRAENRRVELVKK